MGEYFQKKDEEYRSSPFRDIFLDALLWIHNENNDPVCKIIRKYKISSSTQTEFKLTREEVESVEKETNNNYHILIQTFLHYLIASSEDHGKSKLVSLCKENVESFFSLLPEVNGGKPAHNLTTILKWTFIRFPRDEKEIKKLVYSHIINGNVDCFRYLSTAHFIMKNGNIPGFFSKDQYIAINERFFKKSVDKKLIYFYLDSYNEYIDYLKDKGKERQKAFLKLYCDFVIANIELFENRTKQILLQKVRDHMDKLGCYSDNEYCIIDSHLDAANQDALNSLSSFKIVLPKKKQDALVEKIKKQKELFSSIRNIQRINKLLLDLSSIRIKDIKNDIEGQKGSLLSLVTEHILDSDGRVMNYDKLNDDEEFSLKANQHFGISVSVCFVLWIRPFFDSFILDDEAKGYIHKIISNNKLVTADRIEIITEQFIDFFNQDFKHSIFDIVEELEESLRYFFKTEKMNIFKRNGTQDLIGLSTIFNDRDENAYRDKLYETIDEDFHFTLKWLLVDHYGFGLRNKAAHRYKSKDLYKSMYSIYAVLHIFRLYNKFQK